MEKYVIKVDSKDQIDRVVGWFLTNTDYRNGIIDTRQKYSGDYKYLSVYDDNPGATHGPSYVKGVWVSSKHWNVDTPLIPFNEWLLLVGYQPKPEPVITVEYRVHYPTTLYGPSVSHVWIRAGIEEGQAQTKLEEIKAIKGSDTYLTKVTTIVERL